MLTVIALVCSLIATPDRRDCVIDRSIRHEVIGRTDNVIGCEMAGLFFAAEHIGALQPDQYLKILCARPDIPAGRG